ncbi:MAG: carboxypeptidase-like regulatory domain-containing protein [Ferruginibacter sp.]
MPLVFNYAVGDTGFVTPEDELFDEVSITMNVPRIGGLEIQGIIQNQELFLPIKELFDFLKIKNTLSANLELMQGFVINPKNTYLIDKTNNRIVYLDKTFSLDKHDLIRTENNLYLRSGFFGQVFGLECVFDFRNLSVTLNTKIDLPVIREMQQELMRRNISKLKGEKKADTTIGRSFPLFHFGMADWSVVSTQVSSGTTNTRLNLGLGGIVAGGELNLSMNYYSNQSLKLRQQSYQWRFVNNEHRALRQVTAGKIFTHSISSLFAPVIGMQFTNAPSTYRKSFGTYTLSNNTEPGWTVELYVNNVLINYTKADASGFFTFEVPMVYGNSFVKLRFYGPFGEEQVSEKYITVPFNFIPLHQLEYTVSSGIVEDNSKGRFTRANFNYGLGRRLTLGGGMEYLSTLTSGRFMPFVQTSLVLGSHLLISAEHAAGVRSKTSINYRLPSNLQFDLVYTKYAKGQTAIQVNQGEEKKLVISMPVKSIKFNAFSRLTFNQFTFPILPNSYGKSQLKTTSAELLFSSSVAGVISNLTTYALFNTPKNPLLYSNLSLAIRLPKGFRFSPQSQYEYRQNKFSMLKAELEKNLGRKGFVNLSYQKDLINNSNSTMTIGMRYNFSFAQTFFSTSRNSKSVTTTQSAHGSLLCDAKTNYIALSNQSQAGKGGVIVIPFLDMNCNGKRELKEPGVSGMKIQVNGGRIENEKNNGDTSIRISGLEAYTSYYLELDPSSFDNIAWQIKKPTIKVVIDPNSFKLIEVPVAVVGEVSGTVSLKKNVEENGLGRIIVNIYNAESILVAKVLTEADGYFSFVGLAPGLYTASVDSFQLNKLNMFSSPLLPFKISAKRDGDIVENLRFILSANMVK